MNDNLEMRIVALERELASVAREIKKFKGEYAKLKKAKAAAAKKKPRVVVKGGGGPGEEK